MQAIRQAARQVVTARGVAAATMEAIAEEAGIAKGTVYLYFKNREELFQHIADSAFSHLEEQVAGAFAAPASFAARLEVLVSTILRFFDENRDYLRLFRSVAETSGQRECCDRHHLYQRFVDTLTAWLRRAHDRGELRQLPPERVALLVAGVINEVTRQRAEESESPSVDDETAWIVSALLGGLVRPAAGEPGDPAERDRT